MLAVILLGLVVFVQIVISLVLFLEASRSKRREPKIFLLVLSTTILWTICNVFLVFVDNATRDNINVFDLVNRLAFTLAILSLLSIYYFSFFFPKEKKLKIPDKVIFLTGATLAVIAPLDAISGTFTFSESVPTYMPGNLSFLIGILASFVIISLYASDIRLIRYTEDQKLKKQTITILTGLTLTIIHAILFLIVIPLVFGQNSLFYAVGYTAPIYFVAVTVFGLLKLGLFDIKLIVARSAGYILSLATVGFISFVTLSVLSGLLDRYNVPIAAQRSLFVALTLFLAISYQPFKKLFDNITKKLFYRDAYETQILLNEFNQAIVSTIDLNQLLMRAGVTIERYLKPENVAFAIRDSDADTIRIISGTDKKVPKEAIEQIRAYVHKNNEKLFVTDALEEDQTELKQLLQEANIGLLARITTNVGVEGNGYIVMGYKKSGNMYNTQDIGAMEIVANELAIAMQNALQFDEIQKFAVTLQEKVDDATKKLRKSNDKLKQMDETKDEFISMASHQLRTPLTSVKGYVSMVIEGDAGDLNPMQKKLLDQAFVSSQRMVYLIADLLNVSRLRTGKFVIEAAPTNLADVIQGEVEQLVETAAGRGLELKYDKPKDFPMLMLDETKVRQVIMNFIDNAIYYTPNGGHINVILKDAGSNIEYTVVDDGLGVPKSEQHHLFSKFYRAGNAKKARPDGTGLGLFMAKKVIVAQGGSIIFKSTEGKGSTFGFSFSKSKLAVPDHYEAPEPLNGIKSGPGANPKK